MLTDDELLAEVKSVAKTHHDYLVSSLSRRACPYRLVSYNSGAIYLSDGRVIRFDARNEPYLAGY